MGAGTAELTQVLADALEEAAVLRRNGHRDQATTLELFVERVKQAAGAHVRWLTESEAILRSGRSVEYLRARFDGYEEQGFARRDGRRRQYLECAIERRVIASLEHARGREVPA